VRVHPEPRDRGHLADAIDAAIEETLSSHDRSGSGMFACDAQRSFADVRLSEHLFRCHRLGYRTLALSLGSVSAAATPMGAMESTDSAILRFYAQATRTRPITLLMSAADRTLGAYADPIPLESVLFGPPVVETSSVGPALESSDSVESADTFGPTPEPGVEPVPEAAIDSPGDSAFEPIPTTLVFEPTPATEPHHAGISELSVELSVEVHLPPTDDASHESHTMQLAPAPAAATAPVPVTMPEAMSLPLAAPAAPALPLPSLTPLITRLRKLDGPQSLQTLEEAFREAYVPLVSALASGREHDDASHATRRFRENFAHAYTLAFPALAGRTRRPAMVFDAFDLAHRQARTLGARSVCMLLVDSLRYDLGLAVKDELDALIAHRSEGAASQTLWAALPSVTSRQLTALANGGTTPHDESPDDLGISLRGRASETPRRIRVASRELYKLDAVRARIQTQSGTSAADVCASFASIGKATAESIAAFSAHLPDRTLLYVFGDHGFTVDAEGQLHEGGATPEEVLVPALSYFLGDPGASWTTA
jgi:hypothetical protein